jgi:hypothetical protein
MEKRIFVPIVHEKLIKEWSICDEHGWRTVELWCQWTAYNDESFILIAHDKDMHEIATNLY